MSCVVKWNGLATLNVIQVIQILLLDTSMRYWAVKYIKKIAQDNHFYVFSSVTIYSEIERAGHFKFLNWYNLRL